MYDDDIDRNGIPDMIQRDPVVIPPEPEAFGEPPDPGLPGITAPIEATAEEAAGAMAEVQNEAQVFDTLSGATNEVLKSIGEGLNTAARK